MPDINLPGSPEAAALLVEREHLRALLRMMPVGVFIVDYTEQELRYAEELARRAAFVVEHALL